MKNDHHLLHSKWKKRILGKTTKLPIYPQICERYTRTYSQVLGQYEGMSILSPIKVIKSRSNQRRQDEVKHLPPTNGAYGNTGFTLLEDSYSKTSNNGPSEKRTTSVQRTGHLPPIDFTIELTSEKRTPLNSEQRTQISPRRTL